MTGGDKCSVSEWCDDNEVTHTQGKLQAPHGVRTTFSAQESSPSQSLCTCPVYSKLLVLILLLPDC